VSAHITTTFAYLLENAKVPNYQITHQLSWLLETFTAIPVDSAILTNALKSPINDYEDVVVEQVALVCVLLLLSREISKTSTQVLSRL
jgi:hypothetical protein